MDEFTLGMKMELYYWYDDAAFCFAAAPFITNSNFDLLAASKIEQCARVIIKCLDNWDEWTDEDTLLIGKCSLSSSEEFSVFAFNLVEEEYEHYILGDETYIENFCYPGTTPFYSPWMKYTNNFWLANWEAAKDLTNAFQVAYMGLPSGNPAFKAPVPRQPWDKIYE
jgi:hypothetical protein